MQQMEGTKNGSSSSSSSNNIGGGGEGDINRGSGGSSPLRMRFNSGKGKVHSYRHA